MPVQKQHWIRQAVVFLFLAFDGFGKNISRVQVLFGHLQHGRNGCSADHESMRPGKGIFPVVLLGEP
ncbi:hypothetical protein [Caenimonas sp. SL110]|uniref:hypothetical protein n=1 Tax=Caenimonas sp. SL110 TaxID=1450524 RepID=UPI00128E47FE|nr:hypothetical protein [Caenimonas sp. SL110]